MNCPKCGHKLIPLFTSVVCDYCEKRQQQPAPSAVGWIHSIPFHLDCYNCFIYTSRTDIVCTGDTPQAVALPSDIQWMDTTLFNWTAKTDYEVRRSTHLYTVYKTKELFESIKDSYTTYVIE